MSVEPTSGDRTGTDDVRPRRRRRFWLRLTLFTAGIAIVAVLAVVATLATLPDEVIRREIVAAVEKATGRELRIDGPARVSFRPNLVIELNKVMLAGAKGADGPPLLSADQVEAEVQLFPLLRRRIDISRARVAKPAITISPEDSELIGGASGAAVTIASLAIADGSLNVAAGGPNPALRVDQLSADLTGVSAEGLQNGSGTFRWRGEPVRFQLRATPASARGGNMLGLDARFEGDHGSTEFAGTFDAAQMVVAGTIGIETPSLRKVLAWFDIKTGPRALAGAAAISGKVEANTSGIKLEDAAIKVPGGEGRVMLNVALGGERPVVAGRIDWSDLKVETLLGAAPAAAGAALERRIKVAEPAASIDDAWSGLGSYLSAVEQSGAAAAVRSLTVSERAAPQSQGWSARPIDLSALSHVDLDLAQTAQTMSYHGLTMEKVKADLKLADGRLAVAVNEMLAGKGTASGTLNVDSRSDPPQLALEAKAENAPLETVLRELFGSRVVSGRTRLDVALKGKGRSERDIVASLGGKAAVTIENGEIIGYNLRRALIEWWRKWTYDPKQRTQFAKLAANLDVERGVMQSAGDVSLSGPDVDITSRGSIRLASRSIEQSLRLKLSPPPQHLPVPLKVTGPWTKPDIGWDLFSVAAEPRALAAPQSVFAAPSGVPTEITASIKRILADKSKAEGLPVEMRTMLQSLAGQ